MTLGAVTVVPGFVDIHVHGGGGGAFPSDPAEMAAATATAVDLHRRHGTTTMIASLVTAHPADLLAQVSAMADLVRVRARRRDPSGGSVAGGGTLRGP